MMKNELRSNQRPPDYLSSVFQRFARCSIPFFNNDFNSDFKYHQNYDLQETMENFVFPEEIKTKLMKMSKLTKEKKNI